MWSSAKTKPAVVILMLISLAAAACGEDLGYGTVIVEREVVSIVDDGWDTEVTFDGTILDSWTLEPIWDARVVLTVWVDTLSDVLWEEWLLYTDHNGFFSVYTPNPALDWWIVDIEVTSPGYRDFWYTVTDVYAGDWITFEIQMDPT